MRPIPSKRQHGMTLLELLVGIAIGLLVIAAAIGTLAITRGTANTVTEISQLQQQAAYALRVIGMQLRQTGALEIVEATPGMGQPFTFTNPDPVLDVIIDGTDGGSGTDTLTVGYQAPSIAAMRRDCNGADPGAPPANVPSTFSVTGTNLMCQGVNAIPQPVLANVVDFQVNYRVNVNTTADPQFRIVTRAQLTSAEHLRHVRAIEICIDLQGTEPTPDAGIPYTNCLGVAAARNNRTHFVSRNVFELRRANVLTTPVVIP
ncbi:MAG: prepilin-type N-terminal cleavage/methylation domain-containing protein [Burkholderiales bacterium]